MWFNRILSYTNSIPGVPCIEIWCAIWYAVIYNTVALYYFRYSVKRRFTVRNINTLVRARAYTTRNLCTSVGFPFSFHYNMSLVYNCVFKIGYLINPRLNYLNLILRVIIIILFNFNWNSNYTLCLSTGVRSYVYVYPYNIPTRRQILICIILCYIEIYYLHKLATLWRYWTTNRKLSPKVKTLV